MIEEKTLTDRQIAEAATAQGFLNCYLRETGRGEKIEDEQIGGPAIRCRLERQGLEVLAPLRYLSPTHRHLFQSPIHYRPEGRSGLLGLDYATLTALLAKELELESGVEDARSDELLWRVIDSCRNVECFVRSRREDEEQLYSFRSTFGETEQALVFGHHLHPTPKSRQDMSEAEVEAYSPEVEATFVPHYFRAHPSIVDESSALTESATELVKGVLREDPAVDVVLKDAYCGDDEHSMIPVHPLQTGLLLRRPEVQRLVSEGLLEHLGPLGRAYKPTSSIRTVYSEDARFMLKFSLGVRITNSVRNNLRKELRRGIKVCYVLDSEIGAGLRERFPEFGLVRDPAYLTIETGDAESGFEVVLRENPFRNGEDATLIAALCQDHVLGRGSRLSRIVERLADEEGRPKGEVSRDWFRRYLDISLRPILWLYFTHGIAPEAHQQNSVLVLENGYPARFFYRDNQGYYFRQSAREELEKLLPDINEIEDDTVVADEVADERLRYYFFINNLFGVVNAFGCGGVASEHDLLTELRAVLKEMEPVGPDSSELIPSLLNWRKLPGKANLLTRLHDMDELAGDLETQSVYVEVDNPLAEVES